MKRPGNAPAGALTSTSVAHPTVSGHLSLLSRRPIALRLRRVRGYNNGMLRLHDNASSGNAYKIRLLLTQLGRKFERIEYDTDRGATRTPEFLRAKNPNGRVPVLEFRIPLPG